MSCRGRLEPVHSLCAFDLVKTSYLELGAHEGVLQDSMNDLTDVLQC